jgi:hypothetical protein
MAVRRLSSIVLLFAMAALTACSGSPSASAPISSSDWTTRDKLDIFCKDSKQASSFYATLPEAWTAAKKTPFESCYTEEKHGNMTVESSDDAKKTQAVLSEVPDADRIGYGGLVAICAEWNDNKTAKDFSTAENHAQVRAALMVCPDSPFAANMQAHLSAPVTTETPIPAPIITSTPTPTVTPTPTPTPSPTPPPTTTVTYRVETDGTIGVITYGNFIDGQMGSEQAADEVAGPVEKTYTFPGHIFDTRGFTSLDVTAQAGAGSHSITCQILLDGREVSKHTSTGAFAVVDCSYSH